VFGIARIARVFHKQERSRHPAAFAVVEDREARDGIARGLDVGGQQRHRIELAPVSAPA
jgi:hypothetical protein